MKSISAMIDEAAAKLRNKVNDKIKESLGGDNTPGDAVGTTVSQPVVESKFSSHNAMTVADPSEYMNRGIMGRVESFLRDCNCEKVTPLTATFVEAKDDRDRFCYGFLTPDYKWNIRIGNNMLNASYVNGDKDVMNMNHYPMYCGFRTTPPDYMNQNFMMPNYYLDESSVNSLCQVLRNIIENPSDMDIFRNVMIYDVKKISSEEELKNLVAKEGSMAAQLGVNNMDDMRELSEKLKSVEDPMERMKIMEEWGRLHY